MFPRYILAFVLSCFVLVSPAFAKDIRVVGDCIALGVGQALRVPTNAKVGISSAAIVGRVPVGFTGTVIISSGSNDPSNPRLPANLETSRARSPKAQWVWIVPQHPRAAAAVRQVAAKHGDPVVTFVAGGDHVHPVSYSVLARSIQARLGSHVAQSKRPAVTHAAH